MTERIILTVPARHLQPGDSIGDHGLGYTVSTMRVLPDGGREFTFVVPFTTHVSTVSVREQDLDFIIFPLTKRGDTHNAAPRNRALGLSEDTHQAVYTATHVEPVASYPVGTRVGDLKHFDRSMKVLFACPEHPASAWLSKDPFSSTVFPQSDSTVDCAPGCKVSIYDFILTHEYLPTRNG